MAIKPYYMIDFSASACTFEIRVNDYPVITQNIEGQVASIIPINFAILESGNQTITAKTLPIAGQTELDSAADLRFKVLLFDVSNDFVFQEQYEEFQSGPVVEQKLPIIIMTGKFVANVPYVLKAWQDGQDLVNIKDVTSKLYTAYNTIASNINSGKYDLFKEKISRRENNMVMSMYLPQTEAQSRLTGLTSDFKSGFKVMPIPHDSVLQFYANNKVVALKKLNGESALYLTNDKTQEELMLDLSFYIPEGKTEFEVI